MNRTSIAAIFICLMSLSFTQTNSMETATKPKGKIIYVYDALCGWCYGFSPVMAELHKNFKDSFDFEVVSGGMVSGDRIGPIGETAPYIKEAYKTVENHTGVKFGSAFVDDVLESGTVIFTSIPPAIALSIVKDQKPEKAMDFAKALQKAVYFDGMAPADLDALSALAAKHGFDADAFLKDLNSTKYMQMAQADFNYTKELGVNGFPTVIYQSPKGKKTVLCRGYTNYKRLSTSVKSLM